MSAARGAMSRWWAKARGLDDAAERGHRPDPHRWVVLDVESSGLDAARDRLIAIAAIAVRVDTGKAPRIDLGDSFEVVLAQPQPANGAGVDKHNILIHGIGVQAQRQGVPPVEGLEAFEHWLADAPIMAFHAAFDETLLQRSMQATLGRRLPNAWLDLADIARVLEPDSRARSLDDWLALRGISCAVRHQAASDALATAELMLALWPGVLAQRVTPDWDGLARLAAQRRWLAR
jgi:DNA polymerase III subunit epsilon